jgi:hypothetical protein
MKLPLRIDDNLSDSVVIAQVYENYSSMISDAVHPPRKPDLLSNIRFPQLPAIVRSVLMHKLNSHTVKIETAHPKKRARGESEATI